MIFLHWNIYIHWSSWILQHEDPLPPCNCPHGSSSTCDRVEWVWSPCSHRPSHTAQNILSHQHYVPHYCLQGTSQGLCEANLRKWYCSESQCDTVYWCLSYFIYPEMKQFAECNILVAATSTFFIALTLCSEPSYTVWIWK